MRRYRANYDVIIMARFSMRVSSILQSSLKKIIGRMFVFSIYIPGQKKVDVCLVQITMSKLMNL